MPTRAADLSVAPRCRTCEAELPRIVSDKSEVARRVELKCAACGTVATYFGPGLILDRRGHDGSPEPG